MFYVQRNKKYKGIIIKQISYAIFQFKLPLTYDNKAQLVNKREERNTWHY